MSHYSAIALPVGVGFSLAMFCGGLLIIFIFIFKKRKTPDFYEAGPGETEDSNSLRPCVFGSGTADFHLKPPHLAISLHVSRVQPARRKTLPAIMLTPPGSQDIPDQEETDGESSNEPANTSQSSMDLLASAKRRFSSFVGLGSDVEGFGRRRSSVRSERFSILEGSPDASLDRLNDDRGHTALSLYRLGKLCFSLSYNERLRVLYITVHRATFLSGRKSGDSNSFIVKVSLLPKSVFTETYSTTVVTAPRNPIFEQTFSYMVLPENLEGRQIKFTLKQIVKCERQKTVGHIWFQLMQRYVQENSGILQDIWRDFVKSEMKSTTSGTVLISLCYREDSSKLRVGVIKAKDLSVEPEETSVYARISLMSAERVLAVQKTHAVSEDLCFPIIDEWFDFTIADHLLSSLCLNVFLCSRNRDNYSHLIGKCVIGPVTYTDGPGLSHWTEINTKRNKAVQVWHSIE